uniref:Uncharacterized protein n=1 Tax=Kwoniella bestiolae CBS 10118 TaxID=1296100 RepID=A0A1B9FSS7_9TREE|nr:hypothetical protein I302_08608 [Kwoniella bestiolae CBS 10118]OCF21829.1 hypothetical protein I302_08608 [Kwoniella bestiolae CBS 10118]
MGNQTSAERALPQELSDLYDFVEAERTWGRPCDITFIFYHPTRHQVPCCCLLNRANSLCHALLLDGYSRQSVKYRSRKRTYEDLSRNWERLVRTWKLMGSGRRILKGNRTDSAWWKNS